jgi:hypothetical protein
MTKRQEEVGDYLLTEIAKGSTSVVRLASQKFGISRQAANRYLKHLVAEGQVVAHGATKDRTYTLPPLADKSLSMPLTLGLEEDRVWRDQVRPLLDGLPDNVMRICQYGFTEILNNAIDHSEGAQAGLTIYRTAMSLRLGVFDDGVGIFNKIKMKFNLEDERQAILELSKGKLTTDPAKHTGEGIFFTSRVFDKFQISSGNLSFAYTPEHGDWLLGDRESNPGTYVEMTIAANSGRTLKEVFDKYTLSPDDYGFSRTHIAMVLARYGDENLVSRSQAKRLLNGLDRFREITFDFSDVPMIGQAFADEIFRVFQLQHPEVHLLWTNTTPEIAQMIGRVRAQNTAGL